MTTENDSLAGLVNQGQQQQMPQVPPTFSYKDVEEGYKIRLKKEREKHQKETEQLKNRLDELEKKVSSGKASSSENLEYQQGLSAVDHGQQQVMSGQLTPEQFEGFVQQRITEEKAKEKLREAFEKDSEFKLLVQQNDAMPENQQLINKVQADLIVASGIDNTAAVLKHLLKNKKDNQSFKLALAHARIDGGRSLNDFIFETSERLQSNVSRPRPNQFDIVPKVSDIGTGDDFSESSYISEKYT